MSDVTKENADVRQLYAAAKMEQKRIADEVIRIDSKIEADVKQLKNDSKRNIEEEKGKVPPEVTALLKQKEDLAKFRGKLSLIRMAVAASIITLLVIFKLAIYDFVIVSNFLTYMLIIAVAGVAAYFSVIPKIKKVDIDIAKLNDREEMKAFDSVVEGIKAKLAADIEWVKTEKYKDEINEVKSRERANKEQIRKLRPEMIDLMYGNAVIFYFEKFAMRTAYEIKLDGVSVAYSSGDKFRVIRINPGYHSLELIYTYTDTEGFKKHVSWSFQVGEENLPLCITSKKVDQYGTCREVTFNELERIMKKELL